MTGKNNVMSFIAILNIVLFITKSTIAFDQLSCCNGSPHKTDLHNTSKKVLICASSQNDAIADEKKDAEQIIQAWQLTSNDQTLYFETEAITELQSPLLDLIIKMYDADVALPFIKSAATFKYLVASLRNKCMAEPSVQTIHEFLDLSDYLNINPQKILEVLRTTSKSELPLLCKAYHERIAKKNYSELLLKQVLEEASPYYPELVENTLPSYAKELHTIPFDETTAFSWSDKHSIIVWQKKADGNWQEHQRLGKLYNFDPEVGHMSHIRSVIKIDDYTIASAGCDYSVIIWKKIKDDWRILQRLNPSYNIFEEEGHIQRINSLILFDQETLISGSWDCTCIVWKKGADEKWYLHTRLGNVHNTNPLHGHVCWITALQKINDTTILSCSFDCTAILWEQFTDGTWHMRQRLGYVRNIHEQFGHTSPISAAVCLDDRTIITGSWDSSCIVWKLRSDNHWHVTQRFGKVYDEKNSCGQTNWVITINKLNENTIASGSADCTTFIWQRDHQGSWCMIHQLGSVNNTDEKKGHTKAIVNVTATDDGKGIITRAVDKSMITWKKNAQKLSYQTLKQESFLRKASSYILSFFHS